MARLTKIVTIPEGNEYSRDTGKAFLLTEMPPRIGFNWTFRLRTISALDVDKMLALFDELTPYYQIIPNPANPAVVRPLVDGDIEEQATIALLNQEMMALHSFTTPANP